MIGDQLSIAEIQRMHATCPAARRLLERELCNSYEKFVSLVYEELDEIFKLMEANPQLYNPLLEDQLTNFIVSHLFRAGFPSEQGAARGGSVDFLVRFARDSWTWVGEAKIFTSVASMREGFLQLATRYRIDHEGKPQGGLIGYLKSSEPDVKLKEWFEELANLKQIDCGACHSIFPRKRHEFYSEHYHNGIGLTLRVRHTLVTLYHRPLDKSGLAAEKFKGMSTSAKKKSEVKVDTKNRGRKSTSQKGRGPKQQP